jgi:hypothetical protein
MTFASEKQRRYVMALMDKLGGDADRIRKKSESPLSFRLDKDTKEAHDAKYEKMIGQFEKEYKKMEDDFKSDVLRSMAHFSEKRGSVPLLPTTFVIRGSNPKQRQKVKRALDMIGDELTMKDINTIHISPDQDVPIVFIGENGISLSERFLGTDGEVAKTILSTVYRKNHPDQSEGSEYAYATEVIDPKIKEFMRKELEERNRKELEVYQVGVAEQPKFEVASSEQIPGNTEIKLVVPEEEKLIEGSLMGVPTTDPKELNRIMQEQIEGSIYYGGVNK